MAGTYAKKYNQVSSSKYDKIIKMRDLVIGKEYFIKKVDKSKFGYICTTTNTDIDFENRKLKLSEIKDEKNNIHFYTNKPLNDYINKNNIVQFLLRITELEKYKKDDIEYIIPKFEVAILKQDRLFSSDDYDELVE